MSASKCYPDKAPKVNRLLDTLSNHLRRELIYYFECVVETDVATLDEIVSHINARVPETTADSLKISVMHIHLPKLEERGWIDYDPRTGDIHYRGHVSAEEFLDDVKEVFVD